MEANEASDLLTIAVLTLLIIIPCWKIFRRVGLNPGFSFLAVIPFLGWLIAAAILAFSKWPAIDATLPGGTRNV